MKLSTLAFSLCLALAAACGAARPNAHPATPPTPPVTGLAWLPADAELVARLEVEPFRQTPLWRAWEQRAQTRDDWVGWPELALVDELSLAGSSERAAGLGPSFVAVFKGRFGDGYLARLAARKGSPVERHRDHAFHRAQDALWLQTGPSILVVCSTDRADFVSKRASEGGESVALANSELMRSLGARVQLAEADFAVIADDRSGVGRRELDRQSAPLGLGLGALVENVVRVGASIDLRSTVSLRLVAETPDSEAASALKARVDRTLARFSGNVLVMALGLSPLVTALHASTEGSHVAVQGTLPESEARELFERAADLLDSAGPGGARAAKPSP